jgi:hypothetical protein
MTMIKKLAAVCCLLAVLLSAGGCRLAKEESGTAEAKDRLIGVFVTTEHLDLFDFEGYINDHTDSALTGGEITTGGDNKKYNGRVYATQTISNGHADYAFEGLDGISFYEPYVPATESADAYNALIGGDGIGDSKVVIAAGDNKGLTLEGTIYVTPEAAGRAYFFNPVYQDAAGNVYVTTGSGSTSIGHTAEGTVFSQSYKESYTETVNGKQTADDVSVTVAVSMKYDAEEFAILQMDDEHTVLARDEYAPGAVPETITPRSGTAYMISESRAKDADGKTQVSRVLYGRDAQYIRSYRDRGDGILLAQDTKIEWQ